MSSSFAAPTPDAIPITFVAKETWGAIRAALAAPAAAFAQSAGFDASPGQCQLLPDAQGALAGVLFGLENAEACDRDPMLPGKLATLLPAATYRFANAPHDSSLGALAFLLGLYRFTRYRAAAKAQPALVAPENVDAAKIARIAQAVAFGRDLVNTPANDLGPDALEQEAVGLAERFGAMAAVTRGDDLLAHNLPLIHAVGRAAGQAPRLVDFAWGRSDAPKVTLVGKGVTFDTGGLDIKPASGMEIMKKDMGGAAAALSLSRMIMEAGLDVRLRTLVPIVENSISANAFRPGDVLKSRKGLTVEIGNTDAEGRLILADALALADEESPALLFDFATLTGAARVALGPDLPPFYTDDEALAGEIARHAAAVRDPLWRLPLWRPYDRLVAGKIADLTNSPGSPFAGSITAALFLQRFVANTKAWAHFDIYAWNPAARAHGPEGGEVQAARALFALVGERFGL
ncbi:M17 family metallopeptidase [Methylocapsa sp. S129]|uniref:leucyl aminopeptidase family protein n=1 Tax=Methylocapsa sp. S129 TaxID=1641869 RepID=UPI00131E234C|nr:leucyl aminopeptidase family protein [Methylocapsa sp. S129]